MKILFMGTPEFAVPCLKMLFEKGYEISAVVTQPDKPKDRGKKISISPVKKFAIENRLNILQPHLIKSVEFLKEVENINTDLMITCAYGKIIPEKVLLIPKYGCVNVHASLLPKLRGPAPMRWTLINGDEVTGITTMLTDKGMDTGDILLREKIQIDENMTYGQLHDIMAETGANQLIKTIESIQNGTLKRIKQNNDESSYAPALNKEITHIDWENSSQNIYNLYRGLLPSPGIHSFYMGKRIKIQTLKISDQNSLEKAPGTILNVSKDGILVATKDKAIKIIEIQVDSGKRMTVESYLCGHTIIEGETLN